MINLEKREDEKLNIYGTKNQNIFDFLLSLENSLDDLKIFTEYVSTLNFRVNIFNKNDILYHENNIFALNSILKKLVFRINKMREDKLYFKNKDYNFMSKYILSDLKNFIFVD